MIKKNENTAELVGLSFGDGGLTYRKNSNRVKFQLRGHLIEDKEHYDSYIIPLFNREVMVPLFSRKVGIVFNKRTKFYGLSVESVNIEFPLNFIGIPSGVKNELSIPKWIKQDRKYLRRFLRGFLDTDGCIFCQKNYSIKNNKFHTQIRIHLSCTSENLMKEIYRMLKSMDFKTLIYSQEPCGNGKRKSYVVKICGGIQVYKWMEEIGSKNPKHITKYLIWKKLGFCPPYTSLNERKKILKKEENPFLYYEARLPERSNGSG
ncbi:LAGLIDADG family homing endonuclease [Candidatus Pacearchaeota archaeon]|nr:LAGLIDADG family homing endonuclease [Candidatus Pacearchaeota archaeon]